MSQAARAIVSVMLLLALRAAEVDGLKIHSTVTGKGRVAVILVHGWTCDETMWSSQVPVLAKSYRVVTLDLPGHGRTGPPKDGKFSLDLFARSVEAVREQVKAERVVLVGHSMGTPVILRYAQLYPEHAAALVLVEGVTGVTRGLNAASMGGPDGLKNREGMIRQRMFSSATTPELQERLLKMMLAAPPETAVGALSATYDPASRFDGVLDVPVLAIYADHSRLTTREYLQAHFPKVEYSEIAGTGHFLMLEKPDEFNRLLLAFLAKL